MKYWTCFCLIVFLSAVSAATSKGAYIGREDQITIGLRIYPISDRYTFRDYLSDLTASTRISDITPENPVRQLEARKDRKYEPLNPIVFRW